MPPKKARSDEESTMNITTNNNSSELGVNMKMQQQQQLYGVRFHQQEHPFDPNQCTIINLDIVMFNQYKESKTLYQQQKAYVNQNNEIVLAELLKSIKASGFDFANTMVSYFDPNRDHYHYCGKDPLDYSIGVPVNCIVSNQLEIKLRNGQRNIVEMLIQEQKCKEENDENDQRLNPVVSSNSSKNRVKERKIGEVVEKVALWRRFYTGFYDEDGKFINMPLDNAALKVGISKKTLDDYLLQIRCGKKFGFNFNKHLNDRIGKLRSFVKTNKGKENNQSSNHNGEDSDGELIE